MFFRLFLVINFCFSGFLLSSACYAADAGDSPSFPMVRSAVSRMLPNQIIDSMRLAENNNFVEVSIPPKIFYVSTDGKYIFTGDLIATKTKKNYSESRRRKQRQELVESVGEDNMIIFAPEKPKYSVTVITDLDCAYCRKFHSQIADYNKLGIEVRYITFPRTGKGSDSYKKTVSVWCAEDKHAALTRAKQGKVIENKTCDNNPVDMHIEVARKLGVQGTPTIILEDGDILPGYAPPARLVQILAQKQQLLQQAKAEN